MSLYLKLYIKQKRLIFEPFLVKLWSSLKKLRKDLYLNEKTKTVIQKKNQGNIATAIILTPKEFQEISFSKISILT